VTPTGHVLGGGDFGPVLSQGDFQRLSRFVRDTLGIAISEAKKGLMEARLRKRLLRLGIGSFHEYCAFLFSPEGMRCELDPLIDELTTNKTDFFRQTDHFALLSEQVLPQMLANGVGKDVPLSVWSAACATGEEPYSLAMTLNEFAVRHPGWRYRIVASDISIAALERTKSATYHAETVKSISPGLLHKYFLRSRDRSLNLYRVIPELRKSLEIRRVNLMDREYGFGIRFHIIFCCNVIIYFDRLTQEQILTKISGQLAPGGLLFTGHSESIAGMDVPLTLQAPAIYRKVS
jgi:chemotaxis protein methyltransferase CheR